ncbi:MAG: hypothetical protein ACJ8C4_06720 [Gemmataceae bacterium]
MEKERAAKAASPPDSGGRADQLDQFKEHLSEPRLRIRLDDWVTASVRSALRRTADDQFPLDARIANGQDVADRLKAYEEAVRPLQEEAILLGRWANPEQCATLCNMIARMSDNLGKPQGGNMLCLALRWYPISVLAHSASVAALSVENYAAFAAVHAAKVDARTRRIGSTAVPVLVPVVESMLELAEASVWRSLRRYEGHSAAESEYRFDTLRPVLDDVLFLGNSYERLFDRYEVLRTWMYADAAEAEWAPVGRYLEKYRGGRGNPYTDLRTETDAQRDQWGPVRAGLFGGSYARFEESAEKIEKNFLDRLSGY